MDILTTIAASKFKTVARNKEKCPISELEKRPLFLRPPLSLTQKLLQPGTSGIIAEFKRKSPSKGMINAQASVEHITTGYVQSGAAALSVLTDEQFFGGSNQDFNLAREHNRCPILRKDFMVDPYQIVEARSIGADVILLIAAILTPIKTKELANLARSLGMETILEIHDISELDHLNDQISLIGVNNRNLKDFFVSPEQSYSIARYLPKGIPAISESGIRQPDDVLAMRTAGYRGFLIGELFMSAQNPVEVCRSFILQLNHNS